MGWDGSSNRIAFPNGLLSLLELEFDNDEPDVSALAILTLGEFGGNDLFSLRFAKMTGKMRSDILEAIVQAYEKLSKHARTAYTSESNCVSPVIGALEHAYQFAAALANPEEKWYADYSQNLKACRDRNRSLAYRREERKRINEEYLVNRGKHLHEKALAALGRISNKCTSKCWYAPNQDRFPNQDQFLKLCPEHSH